MAHYNQRERREKADDEASLKGARVTHESLNKALNLTIL
jgi:hypothetical protein